MCMAIKLYDNIDLYINFFYIYIYIYIYIYNIHYIL